MGEAADKVITILQINDTHGYLEEHQEMFWDGENKTHRVVGGYPRIKTYLDQVRAERGSDCVIALDNGDTLHGTFPAVKSAGNAFVEPLNKLGLDAWTVHWDIAYGKHHLEDVAAELNYPLLAANCHSTSRSKDPFPPSITVERAGLTVGIIGVAATIIDKSFPARWSEGLRFTIGEEEVREEIRRLRQEEKADLIIMLSHLGFPQDCKFASRVEGIDVIVSGHTHNRMYEPLTVGDATIFQSGCHGSFVGRLDVKVREDGVVEVLKHELVELNEQIEPAAEMQRLVDAIYEGHRESLAELVGNTETDLNRYTTLESTMDNLLLDAIATSAGTEIAFSNGWRYGAPIPAGPITRNDLWNIIPTNPMVQMVQMSGKELREMMEENLEKTFSADPYQQMGGYVKRCRGVNVYFKMENPPGARIQQFFAEGAPLEDDHLYTVSFVTEQGVPPHYDRNRTDTGVEAIENYLDHNKRVNADLRGTVVAV